MITLKSSTAMSLLVVAMTVGFLITPSWGSDPALELLSIGQPGHSAIGLSVCTNIKPGEAPKEGDRLTLSVQADRDAYLTALSVSSSGDVTILFPGKDTASTLLKKGKAYSLFGSDSRLRLILGKPIDRSHLVLYVSTKQPHFKRFAASKATGAITIPANAVKEIKALKAELEDVARSEGFNRLLVAVNGDRNKQFEVSLVPTPGPLMGGARPILKKLPTSVDSTPPETVTGVQGVKPQLPE